jgi:hypothetical protein
MTPRHLSPRRIARCGGALWLLALVGLALAPRPATAQSEKVTLRLRLPAGERLRYRDRFETWVSLPSTPARQPALRVEIWRTETADTRGDTITVVSVVDSARALAIEGLAPPELDRQARLMRGTRETWLYTSAGREMSYTVRGVTVDDVFAILTGGRAPRRREARHWRAMPEDSVEEGGAWSDSVLVRVDSAAWRGRIQYRLRRLEQREGRLVGRITASGMLRSEQRYVAPDRVSADSYLDVETGRLIRSHVRINGGISAPDYAIMVRTEWKIEQVP